MMDADYLECVRVVNDAFEYKDFGPEDRIQEDIDFAKSVLNLAKSIANADAIAQAKMQLAWHKAELRDLKRDDEMKQLEKCPDFNIDRKTQDLMGALLEENAKHCETLQKLHKANRIIQRYKRRQKAKRWFRKIF